MMLHIAWLIYFPFLLAAGALLCILSSRSEGTAKAPFLAKAALMAGKGFWVLLTCASCAFAMLTLKPEFAEFFWRGEAHLKGNLSSALAALIILVGQTIGRKKKSHFRFLILPLLLFIAAMPAAMRIFGDSIYQAVF